MNATPLKTMAQWLGIKLPEAIADHIVTGVCTDSRCISEGDLFIALDGENFQGSDHLQEALNTGAIAAISPRSGIADERVLIVDDATEALGCLAHQYRLTLGCVVIAITGSVGKTTVKEMLRGILSESHQVVASTKSFNNRIGVPLTLLSANDQTELLIVEVGSNARGEISELSMMAQPTVGVITAIARAHLEGLGSLEGVKAEKLSLIDGMTDGVPLYLNADDALLNEVQLSSHEVRRFGLTSKGGFSPDGVLVNEDSCLLRWVDGEEVKVAMGGHHNALNLLAAVAVARGQGMPFDAIGRGAAAIAKPPLRNERLLLNGWDLTLDCYNANPASMAAALDAFGAGSSSEVGSVRQVVVLGDMLELGDSSAQLHTEVGQQVAEMGVDLLLLVGDEMSAAAQSAMEHGMDSQSVIQFSRANKHGVIDHLRDGDRVFVKGSRGFALEEIFQSLCEEVS